MRLFADLFGIGDKTRRPRCKSPSRDDRGSEDYESCDVEVSGKRPRRRSSDPALFCRTIKRERSNSGSLLPRQASLPELLNSIPLEPIELSCPDILSPGPIFTTGVAEEVCIPVHLFRLSSHDHL